MSERIVSDAQLAVFGLSFAVLADDYRWAGAPEVVRCRDCAHSRIERHTGDEQLVCWVRKCAGYAVPDFGYCHLATRAGE